MSRARAAVLLCAALCGTGAQAGTSTGTGTVSVTGAGATFPAPLYVAWAQQYRAETGVELNYQAIGSGGGIRQIKAGTVDFGASDKPLGAAELAAAGLVQFPTVVGGVVAIVNVPGLPPGRLRLTGAVLGDVYLGRIKRWNDPAIARLNPDIHMPPLPITVVHRSDGSGTSFLFTSYLKAVSPAWARVVGASDSVKWPAGIGGKGNDGVAVFVKQTLGAIGYVEYAYTRHDRVTWLLIQNRAGHYPQPGPTSFAAAAVDANWASTPGDGVVLVDQPGAAAWPITGATFILMKREAPDPRRAGQVLRFFAWAQARGDAAATALTFVTLPAPVKALVRSQWAQVRAGGRPVFTPQ
jgi:phosphate transport system substrate-binding protein